MSGNTIGGHRAAAKNRALYGADFYARIGAMGGRKSTTGGFAANRELARAAGRIGGLKSRRRKAAKSTDEATRSDFTLAA